MPTTHGTTTSIRHEALLMLEGGGRLLETAREVSRLLPADQAAVVGGIAVLLHGHVRTTRDIDLYVPGDPQELHQRLVAAGFRFDPDRREFRRDGIPVLLLRPEQIPEPPREFVEINGIRTVSLFDLLAIKLRGGSRNVLRAQDLADVIGLMRYHQLTTRDASKLPKDLRAEFRKLAKALASESA